MSAGAPRIVVVADPIDPEAIARLRAGPCEVVDASRAPAPPPEALRAAWGLLVRSRTKVTAKFLEGAPALRFIGRAGVGVDNIDVPAATARGIQVVNAPAAATASVVELTVAFLLLLARGLYPRIQQTKAGTWSRSELGHELSGKTVGFVGYGRIARGVAHALEPFGCPTIAYDPFLPKAVDGTALRSLDELLAEADFVSLHAAATPENHHLLDAARIARMKPTAALINVARGTLVDDAALLAALTEGRLAGAALDVFEVEPPTAAALLAHPKVLPTPHLGASTHEGQARAGRDVVAEALRALAGEPLGSLVNPSGRP